MSPYKYAITEQGKKYCVWEEKLFYERLGGKMKGKIEDILDLLEEIEPISEE